MNSVERVKAICKERKIPISRLEKDCGFSNGYISQLKKGRFPDDRLYVVAEYLSVSPKYLLIGEDEGVKNPATESDGKMGKYDYIINLFDRLPFEKQIELANWMQAELRRQEVPGDPEASE